MLSSIVRERPLVGAEADEHRPVVGHGPVGHVAAEDLPEAILVGARDVRVVGLGPRARRCRASSARSPAPARATEAPPRRVASWAHFWSSSTVPPAPGLPSGITDELRRLDQRRVLGSVDEAGQVAIVLVRPARRLLGDRGEPVELARSPSGRRRRSRRRRCRRARARRRAAWPASRTRRTPTGRRRSPRRRRCVVGRDLAPELGPEAGDEVDAAHRRPRLAQRRDRVHEVAGAQPARAGRTRGRRVTRCRARRSRLRVTHRGLPVRLPMADTRTWGHPAACRRDEGVSSCPCPWRLSS